MITAFIGVAFVQGLTGSIHCTLMCGPFAHAIASKANGGMNLQIIYNAGRSVSYTIFGYLLGLSGGALNRFVLSGAAAVVGGFFLVLFGIGIVFPSLSVHLRMPGIVVRSLTNVMRSQTSASAVAFGFGSLSGLLPCGVLWPAYALALSTGVPWIGALVMLSFSLGTYPAMIALGASSSVLWKSIRKPVWRITFALLMVGLGIYTIIDRMQIDALCRPAV